MQVCALIDVAPSTYPRDRCLNPFPRSFDLYVGPFQSATINFFMQLRFLLGRCDFVRSFRGVPARMDRNSAKREKGSNFESKYRKRIARKNAWTCRTTTSITVRTVEAQPMKCATNPGQAIPGREQIWRSKIIRRGAQKYFL